MLVGEVVILYPHLIYDRGESGLPVVYGLSLIVLDEMEATVSIPADFVEHTHYLIE